MCRHTGQAILKSKGKLPQWLKMVLGDVDSAGSTEHEKEECGNVVMKKPCAAPCAAEGDAWITGYDRDHHKAWGAKPGCKKDFVRPYAPLGATPQDCARARWDDGFDVELTQLLVGELDSIKSKLNTGRGKVPREWEGVLQSGEKNCGSPSKKTTSS